MSKHTPGPWYAPPLPASSTDFGIMHLPQHKAPVLVAMVVIDEDDPQTDDEHAANARLIAAAPDMLAALEEIAKGHTPPEKHGHYTAHRNAVKLARAIVAKVYATGKEAQ